MNACLSLFEYVSHSRRIRRFAHLFVAAMANNISPFGLAGTSSPPPDWASASEMGSAAVSPKVSIGSAGARDDEEEEEKEEEEPGREDFAVDACFDEEVVLDDTAAPDASDTNERTERSDTRIVTKFVQGVLRLKIRQTKATV
jgi:hypothetical protein